MMQLAQDRTHPHTQVLCHAVPTCLQRHGQLWSWLRDTWIRQEAKECRHLHAEFRDHNRFNLIKDTRRSTGCRSHRFSQEGRTLARSVRMKFYELHRAREFSALQQGRGRKFQLALQG